MSEETPTRVLIIEDDEDDFELTRRALSKGRRDFECYRAEGLVGLTNSCQPKVVLLDLNLSDSRGISTLEKVEPLFPGIPIIVLTGLDNDEIGVAAMKAGAQDYICKTELFTSSLPRAIDFAIERQRFLAQIQQMALYDALTKLPNRVLFADQAKRAIARARRQEQQCGVALLDLDGFKAVNDQHGHAAGDQVLITVAERMRAQCRDTDQIGRLGGDEFTLIFENVLGDEGARKAAGRFARAIEAPISLTTPSDSVSVNVFASIGVALFPQHGEDPETLLLLADRAMYEAKRDGKSKTKIAVDPPGTQ